MRYASLLILVCLLIFPAAAQTDVDCGDGLTFEGQLTVQAPALPAQNYSVTAIGLGDFDPTVAVVNSEDLGFCSDDELDASYYEADLPVTGEVLPSERNAQLVFWGESATTLVVGEYDNQPGEMLMIFEGGALTETGPSDDRYLVDITPSMVSSGVGLTAYIFATEDTLDPTLTLLDSAGDVVQDEAGDPITCDNAGDSESCYGETDNLENASVTLFDGILRGQPVDAGLTIPLTEDIAGTTVQLQVGSAGSTTGGYVLVLHVGTGEEATSNGEADLFSGPLGEVVACDGRTAFENGVRFNLPTLATSAERTVTVVGIADFDPVAAVFSALDEPGTCFDDTESALEYGANLPTTGQVNGTFTSAQFTVSGEQAAFVVGGRDSTPGEFLVFIEGGRVLEDDGVGDVVTVQISPAMADAGQDLSAYMIATTDTLNPMLSQVDESQIVMTDEEEVPVTCDDAGDPFLCWGASEVLDGFELTLNGERLPSFTIDAMLALPLSVDMEGGYINLLPGSSVEEKSAGPYVLVLHIITN